jgi:signal peptidase I
MNLILSSIYIEFNNEIKMKRKNKEDMPLLFKMILTFTGLISGTIIIHSILMIMPVNTSAMEPALNRGDHILINRLSYPAKGDIAVYTSPSENGPLLISRVIATEYETVELRNRIVYINNEPLMMPSSIETAGVFPMKFSFRDNMPPVKLERGEYFMLSDNFDSSFDSRSFGPVKSDSITGRVIYKR